MLEQQSNGDWPPAPCAGLLAATVQSDSLLAAIVAVEQAMERSGNGSGPLSRALRSNLGTVRANLQQHVHRSEAPGGFLRDITQDGPRFVQRAETLKRAHQQLEMQLDALEFALSIDAGTGPAAEAAEQQVGRQACQLLHQLRAHLEQGSKLIFDAYMHDVGDSE
jgi:hypothetical protein